MTGDRPITVGATSADAIDRDALQRLWLEVTLAGGAVGLRAPATLDDTRPLADDLLRKAAAGDYELIVARATSPSGEPAEPAEPDGLVALHRDTAARREHRATLRRLMVDPSLQGAGIGTRLVVEAHDIARRRGIEVVLAEVRDGLGLERFYEGLGYRLYGRLTDGLEFGDDRIDELLYAFDLRTPR